MAGERGTQNGTQAGTQAGTEDGTPVLVGLTLAPGEQPADLAHQTLDLTIDRRRLVLSADQEVVLRCGKASITLTADGKVTIRGSDVVSTAVRTNRIRGGAVRIN